MPFGNRRGIFHERELRRGLGYHTQFEVLNRQDDTLIRCKDNIIDIDALALCSRRKAQTFIWLYGSIVLRQIQISHCPISRYIVDLCQCDRFCLRCLICNSLYLERTTGRTGAHVKVNEQVFEVLYIQSRRYNLRLVVRVSTRAAYRSIVDSQALGAREFVGCTYTRFGVCTIIQRLPAIGNGIAIISLKVISIWKCGYERALGLELINRAPFALVCFRAERLHVRIVGSVTGQSADNRLFIGNSRFCHRCIGLRVCIFVRKNAYEVRCTFVVRVPRQFNRISTYLAYDIRRLETSLDKVDGDIVNIDITDRVGSRGRVLRVQRFQRYIGTEVTFIIAFISLKGVHLVRERITSSALNRVIRHRDERTRVIRIGHHTYFVIVVVRCRCITRSYLHIELQPFHRIYIQCGECKVVVVILCCLPEIKRQITCSAGSNI